MNRTHMLALGLVLLTACFEKADDDEDEDDGDGGGGTMSEDAFLTQYTDFFCQWAMDCGLGDLFGGSLEACQSEIGPSLAESFGPSGSCTYDPSLGPACLAELEEYFSSCDPDSTESVAPSCEAMCENETEVDTGWDAKTDEP